MKRVIFLFIIVSAALFGGVLIPYHATHAADEVRCCVCKPDSACAHPPQTMTGPTTTTGPACDAQCGGNPACVLSFDRGECPAPSAPIPESVVVGFGNPLCRLGPGKTCDIPTIIGNIIRAILGIVGSVALLMFVYGGILWMTAQGNMETIKKAKAILMWATLGLAVIFTSYAAVQFIVEQAAH